MRAIARLFIFLIGMIGLTGFSATDQGQNSNEDAFDQVDKTFEKVCVVDSNQFVGDLHLSDCLFKHTKKECFSLSKSIIHYDKFQLKNYNYTRYYKIYKSLSNFKTKTKKLRNPRDSLVMGIS